MIVGRAQISFDCQSAWFPTLIGTTNPLIRLALPGSSFGADSHKACVRRTRAWSGGGRMARGSRLWLSAADWIVGNRILRRISTFLDREGLLLTHNYQGLSGKELGFSVDVSTATRPYRHIKQRRDSHGPGGER